MSEKDKGLTLGEEIEEWKQRYNKTDKIGKWMLQQIAAADHFKAEQIWEFVKTQKLITKEEAFKDAPPI